MQTLLITGISGQVGSQLADYALEKTELSVVGLIRWQDSLDNLYHLTTRINSGDRIQLAYGDLNDLTSLQRIIEEVRPEFISHLAAQSFPKTSFDSPIETLQTNVIGTANLLEAVRLVKDVADSDYDPIIHVCSSSEVYGRQASGAQLNESTPFHGSSPYSISKIGTDFLGRFYAEAYSLKTFITRMGSHSGPRRSDVFFESTVAKQIALIEAGLQEKSIKVGNLESIRTYQDARDAVRAYYLLMLASSRGEVPPGEVFNIAGQEAFQLQEIIDRLVSMSSTTGISVTVDPNRLRPIDADYQMFDNSKLKSFIDWRPEISVNAMLGDLLNHWRDQIKMGRIPLQR